MVTQLFSSRKHKNRSLTNHHLSEYPIGTFVKTELGVFYVVSDEKRFIFITSRVLDSWAPQRIVETSEERVGHLRIASKMKFRDGSLLWSQSDAKMYLVSNGRIRHIQSPDILSGLGVSHKDAVWVSSDEINLHTQGAALK